MRRLSIFFLLALLINLCVCISLRGADNEAFTLIAGRLAATEGAVILAHNENSPGKNRYVGVWKVPASRLRTTITRSHNDEEASGLSIPLLCLHALGAGTGDSCFNEKSVSVCANICPSREDRGKPVDNSISFVLQRVLAENAASARAAVIMAGQLIDSYGYDESGGSYAIADKNEAWILQAVRGKHWIAQRIPDNHVAVVSNCFTIGTVNLKDSANFLGSPDLVEYAVRRGWHNPIRDGAFHFARCYAARGSLENEVNQLRQWRVLSLFSRQKYEKILPLPFSFQPAAKLELIQIFRLLRDHYEETVYDLTDGYEKGSPNQAKVRGICAANTRYSFVAEMRANISDPLSIRVWISFRRPDANAFSPWYVSMTDVPDGYSRGSYHALVRENTAETDPYAPPDKKYFYWICAELSEVIDRSYQFAIRNPRKEWKTYEDYMIKRIKKLETEFEYQLKINPVVGVKIITSYVHNLEYRRWVMTEELLRHVVRGNKN